MLSVMHPALRHVDHRPWPLPVRAWTWRQTWDDLLFAHWHLPAREIEDRLPRGLKVDTFEGQAYLGVVPFRMEGVMRRPLPDLPGISAFPELNVRTYVTRDGIGGVYFFSLDATNPLAVWAARTFFHLPYYRAEIEIRPASAGGLDYTLARRGAAPRFEAHYAPTSEPYLAKPGTLEHFLTERYCLYADRADGALTRTQVHHEPWPLQRATADVRVNSMTSPLGLSLVGAPTTLHFAKHLDVVVWSPESLS